MNDPAPHARRLTHHQPPHRTPAEAPRHGPADARRPQADAPHRTPAEAPRHGPADAPHRAAADAPGGASLRTQLGALTTEEFRPDLADVDTRSTLDIARAMNDGDRAVPEAVTGQLPRIAAAVDAIAARMARGGRLVYAGAGTAGRLGVLDASECPPTFNADPSQVVGLIAGGPEALVRSVEGAEDAASLAHDDLKALDLSPDDTVVGVSASGRTPYAVGAVEYARDAGALTVGVACNTGSALAAAADHAIEVVVGPEFITGSTRLKSGTAQKLVLNMLSTITMIRLGKTYGNLMVDVRATNDKLRARSHRIVAQATGASDGEIAAALEATGGEVKHAILVLLGGVDAPTAARLLAEHHGHLRAALSAVP
ncbi:N-acetylmuramic acid 6-phosphate etherase [Streptomyces kanasensis]|uniref:N-acetylmuramic acid 6-phosphate etherase n=1 Tax=Streptomyces kanasensis TaxID=936756 RepID=UPI0036FECCD9